MAFSDLDRQGNKYKGTENENDQTDNSDRGTQEMDSMVHHLIEELLDDPIQEDEPPPLPGSSRNNNVDNHKIKPFDISSILNLPTYPQSSFHQPQANLASLTNGFSSSQDHQSYPRNDWNNFVPLSNPTNDTAQSPNMAYGNNYYNQHKPVNAFFQETNESDYSMPNFDMNLLRLAAQEVSNNPNFNMNSSGEYLSNGFGKADYYNGGINPYMEYNQQYSPNQLMPSPVDYSMNRDYRNFNGNSDRSVAIPLLDLTERPNNYHQMGNGMAHQPMQKPLNYRNGAAHECNNWNNGRYAESAPPGVEYDPLKDILMSKNTNDFNNQHMSYPPNNNYNRAYNNPPPLPYIYDGSFNKMRQMVENKEYQRSLAQEQEEALKKFLQQKIAQQTNSQAPPYKRAISKANHFNQMNVSPKSNVFDGNYLFAPATAAETQYNYMQISKKNALQAYLEGHNYKENDKFMNASQRDQMISEIEKANSNYMTQKQLYQREGQESLRYSKTRSAISLDEGKLKLASPPVSTLSPKGTYKPTPNCVDWLPLMHLRNFRRTDASGILHVRLEVCYEQWRQLERERKQTEAELARAFPGRMVSSANSIPIPRTPPTASRVDRLAIDMLREHTKVITLMGKMEALRSSAITKDKGEESQSTAVSRMLNRDKVIVLKRGEALSDGASSSSSQESDDDESLKVIISKISVNTHPEIDLAIQAWKTAVKDMESARILELQHENEDKYVLDLAEKVKVLSVCAKKAREAMWCDLTLTKAMAAKPKPKVAQATVTSVASKLVPANAEPKALPAPKPTQVKNPVLPATPQPAIKKPIVETTINSLQYNRNAKTISSRANGMQYTHSERNRFNQPFCNMQNVNGPIGHSRHLPKPNHNNNFVTAAPIK